MKIPNSKKGFTLIEIVVVMAVFLFVIGAAVVIFISIVQGQKRILSEQELLNQISYVEEYMSKAIRMAKSSLSDSDNVCLTDLGNIFLLTSPYTSCDVSDPQCGFYRGIKFLNQTDVDGAGNAACQEFFLDSNGVLKETNDVKNLDSVPLTPTSFKINYIKFAVNGLDGLIADCGGGDPCVGARKSDDVQPRVTILMNVSIPGDGQRTIQTTVSQRNLKIK